MLVGSGGCAGWLWWLDVIMVMIAAATDARHEDSWGPTKNASDPVVPVSLIPPGGSN